MLGAQPAETDSAHVFSNDTMFRLCTLPGMIWPACSAHSIMLLPILHGSRKHQHVMTWCTIRCHRLPAAELKARPPGRCCTVAGLETRDDNNAKAVLQTSD